MLKLASRVNSKIALIDSLATTLRRIPVKPLPNTQSLLNLVWIQKRI